MNHKMKWTPREYHMRHQGRNRTSEATREHSRHSKQHASTKLAQKQLRSHQHLRTLSMLSPTQPAAELRLTSLTCVKYGVST